MTSYEAIYSGSESIIPKYSTFGYSEEVRHIGMSTDPRTANQLKEINVKMNPGVKHMEVGGIQAAVFESIPEEHLDEIRRLSKLTGVTTSVHAPIVEATGIGERGWEETNRIGAEHQLESALLRSHKVDPNGNISVTVHTSAQLPEMISKIKVKNPETGKLEEKQVNMWIINPESGRYNLLQPEKRFFPRDGEEFTETAKPFDPVSELKKINDDQWTQQLSEVNRMATYGEDILERLQRNYDIPKEIFSDVVKGTDINKISDEFDKDIFKQAQREIIHGQIYLKDSYRNLRTMFDRAWQSADEKEKDKLRKFAQKYSDEIKPGIEADIEKLPVLKEVVEEGLKLLRDIKEPPKTWVPMQDFAMDKAAETFANVATSSWKKYKDKSPILNIENPPAGSGFSTAEDLRDIIKKSREKLAENLRKDGMGADEARRASEKIIGATWDVGHINMLRKKGYTEEDIVKQTEIIAPFVNHVHLSDNFGLDHTELPMGMGNVPMKEMMKKLGEKGFEGKKIIEAGNWWQYFAEQGGGNPFLPTVRNFDSPIYAMKQGYSWSQQGIYGAYYGGHGPVNPQVHHTTYGSGFQNLPVEMGGEIPGQQSRFSGTPNQ